MRALAKIHWANVGALTVLAVGAITLFATYFGGLLFAAPGG